VTTPLNPEALKAVQEWMKFKDATFGLHWMNAKPIIETYLSAVAQPVVNTLEELDALPGESVVLDAEYFPYRRVPEYEEHGPYWEGIDCGDPLDVSTLIFPAIVIHTPGASDA